MNEEKHFAVIVPRLKVVEFFSSQLEAELYSELVDMGFSKRCYIVDTQDEENFRLVQWWQQFFNLNKKIL